MAMPRKAFIARNVSGCKRKHCMNVKMSLEY